MRIAITVEPRFNEVPRDWENWFVKSRVRHIEVRFSSTVEPRFNEPLYNEVVGITNDILQLKEIKSQ